MTDCMHARAGMDVECVYEEALQMYLPCKNNPMRLSRTLRQALERLCPKDEDVWRRVRAHGSAGSDRTWGACWRPACHTGSARMRHAYEACCSGLSMRLIANTALHA